MPKTQKNNGADGRYVIIRSTNAGCFAGELIARDGDCVTLRNARRLWYWSGAASLSQLAIKGTSIPKGCKFPIPTKQQEVLGVIEIINTTEAARKSIEGVPVWKA